MRAKVVPHASGRVLEIGIGTGLNLSFYDASKVTEIVGVDPAAQMQGLAKERASKISIPVECIALELGQIKAAENSFDCIVCTFTLCSISDPIAALKEMRRVLKPGGRFLFAEHALSPEPDVAAFQTKWNGWWSACAGGCQLNRPIPEIIEEGGFKITDIVSGYKPGPKCLSYCHHGVAI
eukprot:gene11574-13507_t